MTVRPSWVTILESSKGHCPQADVALRRSKDQVE
jgi:hypothetical protein